MILLATLLVLAVAALGWWLARRRARQVELRAHGHRDRLHSRPVYHGLYVAIWTGVPALLLLLAWIVVQGPVLDALLLSSLPQDVVRELDENARAVLLNEIKTRAAGNALPGQPAPYVLEAVQRLLRWRAIADMAALALSLAVALAGLAFSWRRLSPSFRARKAVERAFTWLMLLCASLAVLTTVGIVLSLIFETMRFFTMVPLSEFLFGLRWEPQIAIRPDQVASSGAFGMIPVFAGTLLISAIALGFAVPVGLLSAIYLVEFASGRFRAVAKPTLEFLAGIPTVVYGFFAILTVAPAIKRFGEALGIAAAPNSALAAGLVMGIMLIPFISSLSDDALAAVPNALREGSIGLGATRAETIRHVLLPAALPGIMAGVLLAASRAIGETMIVVMAAGIIATLTLNPFEAVTTVTVQIVTLLIGDTEFDNPKTLAAFALGFVLFLVTLALNMLSMHIVRKYREQYD